MRDRREAEGRRSRGARSLNSSSATPCWISLLLTLLLWPLSVASDSGSVAKPPSQVLCVDPNCLGVISTATTMTKYIKQAEFLLSFKSNTQLRVIAKPVDKNEEYWAVEMNGAFGFVPKGFLRESSILARAGHLVNIEDFLKIISKNSHDTQHHRKKNGAETENEGGETENEGADIENKGANIENKGADIENKGADIENEGADIENEDVDEDDYIEDPTTPPSKKHKKRDRAYKDLKDADKVHKENDMIDNSTKPSIKKHKRTDPSYRNVKDDDLYVEDNIMDDPTKPPHRRHKRTDSPDNDVKVTADGIDVEKPSHKKRERTDSPDNDIKVTADGIDVEKPSHKKRERTDPSYDEKYATDDVDIEKPSHRKRERTDPSYDEKYATDDVDIEKPSHRKRERTDPSYHNKKEPMGVNEFERPSHRKRDRTDPSYVDEKYRDSKIPKDKKDYTDELQLSTTTTEPIISSALPESDPNSEKISATQSVTVFDGTTIYESMKSEEQIYAKSAFNVQDTNNSKTSESGNTTNDIDNSINNEPKSDGEKTTVVEPNMEDKEQPNIQFFNPTPTPYMLQENMNIDNTSNNNLGTEVTSQESDIDEDDDEDDEDDDDTDETDSEVVFADKENINITNVFTGSDIKNTSYDAVDKDVPQESLESNTNDGNTPEKSDKSSDVEQKINSEPAELASTVASNIESVNILPVESIESNISNSNQDENENVTEINKFPSQDEILNKEHIEFPSPEDSKYYNDTEKNDSNETDVPENTPSSKEKENDAPFYNVPLLHTLMSSPPPINLNTNSEIESTSEEYISDVETDGEKPELPLNDQPYESHLTFESTPTTVASDVSDFIPELDPSLSHSTTEMNIFDYAENLNDNDQPSNLLDSDIENEKSFFVSPLILLNSMYESISNIFKSDGISNTVEKANTNIFNTEEINSNDYQQQYENTHHSNKYRPLLTETSQCSAEEKTLPSLSDVSTDFLFWLIVSAITVLAFTLGYYYLENRKQDGKLLAMVNSLQKELLCSSKECIILKEELTTTKEKLTGIEDSSFGTDEMVACLKKELLESEQVISDLQEKITSAEDELANSTEAALELQSILDEQLSAKDTSSSSLAFTITNLQNQLDDQQTTMNLTKAQLAAKVEENELLLLKIMDANNRSSSVEKQLINTQDSLKQAVQENESKSQQLLELASNLEKSLLQAEIQKNTEVKELQLLIRDLKDDLNTTKASLKASSHEVLNLQDNIKMLNMDEKNISSILDVSHIKAELVKVSSEKSSLVEKFEAKSALVADLNKKIDSQNLKISEIKEQLHEAEQKTLQSTTRLEVLTNYFNQKEADLLKELSTKESLWMSQRGEAMSTVEKIQSLQKEIQQHKETSESIRREVVEQEAAWRAKVAALEQRSHEHWLARRAAERSAEASAREAQTLRQRLAVPSPDKRVVSPLTTGESLPDPAFMPSLGALGGMLPPPPLGFLPPPLGGPMMLPPPLPPLPPHRPPALGRLSSPPPLQSMRQDRYSPDSRYSPDRGYSPQQRGRSPFSNSESRRRTYNNRRYDDRYYDSEEDRRSRRYETETDFSPVNTLPPSPIPNSRNHKGARSGSGQSSDSLEKFK